MVGSKRAILGGWNTQPVERGRLPGEEAHQRLGKQRQDFALVNRALFVLRAGSQHGAQVTPVQARDEMHGTDKNAEQAETVEAARKTGDATAARPFARLPIMARRGVEMWHQMLVIGGDICLVAGIGKEAPERLVIRQAHRRRQLQAVQRNMGGVEIDRRDFLRLGEEIARNIAAARGNGDHMVGLADAERVHVDDRIFPDLRIDQATEEECEQPLQRALGRKGAVAMDRSSQLRMRGASLDT